MPELFDCIVLGVGGFGSGAFYHLAKRGQRLLGIERFGIAHDRGSSHGETRIIRKAYIEHPDYVPLVLRAYELWDELESETNQTLYQTSGLIVAGRANSNAILGTKLAAEQHRLPIDEIELSAARRRFSGFRFDDDFAVMFDTDAGYLFVEDCVRAHIDQAVAYGASLKTDERVVDWESNGHSVRVRTDRGSYEADRLVVTAGAWSNQLLAELGIRLQVVRKPLFWHEVTSPIYDAADGAPTFYYEIPTGDFYGFPSLDGRRIKLAEHTGGRDVPDPLHVDRTICDDDTTPVGDFLEAYMPGVRREPLAHSVCMYTNTPDHHFIVDRHPRYENVVVGAGFSGHGFKFTSVLGEALADLAIEGRTDLPIEFLSIDRESLR